MRNSLAISVPVTSHADVRAMQAAILSRDRSQPHYGRKFYHMLMGLTCFSLYAFLLSRTEALAALAMFGGVLIFFDICRFRFPQINALSMRVFGPVMRREELKSVSGNSFFVLGLFVVVAFFPKPVALLSVLYLAVGDPIAAVVGTRWGKHKLPFGHKSLEGSGANLAAAALASLLFGTFYLRMPFESALALAAIGGVASVVAEALPLPINDNFTIPTVSALLLSVGALLVPLF